MLEQTWMIGLGMSTKATVAGSVSTSANSSCLGDIGACLVMFGKMAGQRGQQHDTDGDAHHRERKLIDPAA